VEKENKLALYEPIPANLESRGPRALSPYEIGEAEEGPNIRAYWQIIRKHLWTIITALLVIVSLGLLATLKQKPVYRAQALLEIAKENPNILTVQELFQLENVSDNYLETQYKVLQSETLARRVIGDLRLDRVKEFSPGAEKGLPADPQTEQIVLRRFQDRLSVEPVRRSRLVQVSFESEDPRLAADVMNALASNYVQENLETRWEATQKASEWLSQQLQNLKAKLEKSEDELQNYAQSHGLLFLETEKGDTENIVDQRLRELQEEMTKAQGDRYEKESLYRLVLAGDYSALPGVVDNKLMQDLTLQLANLERQKAELTLVFSDTYPRVKETQSQIDRIEQMLTQERKRAAEKISNDYLAAVRRESLFSQAFEDQRKQANLVAERSVQYNILKREVDSNKQLYEGLLQRLKEAGVSAGLKASNIRIVDAAVPPTKPVKPRILLNMTLALSLGLSFGIGMAFLQEHLDNTLKTAEDVERFLRVPALAFIPSRDSLHHHAKRLYGQAEQGALKTNGNGHSLPLEKNLANVWVRIDAGYGTPHSALSEVFGGLRTSVLLSKAGKPPRSLTFVSAHPSEGKTTVASNLAISLAQLGKRVLLIDGDMRRPCIHKMFDIQSSSTGLVGYLTGQEHWTGLVQHTGISDLDCLPCGPIPPNPSELLSSERMPALIREALNEYQFVLVDAPPLLNVADGRILATMVEGAILVVKGGATRRELVQRARLYVRDVGAHLIGVVLNNVDLRTDGYYDSYYRYSYGTGENGHAQRNN